jgi:hypothetical protein
MSAKLNLSTTVNKFYRRRVVSPPEKMLKVIALAENGKFSFY